MTRSIVQQAWQWLDRELERWRQQNRVANFWWRDDDAVRPGAELERLLELSASRELPASLAVIPARLEAELAPRLRDEARITVMQHGYDHRNHAPRGELKREIGGSRPAARLLADLAAGRELLETSFGHGFIPVLVPPWNRIDEALIGSLPAAGFRGISTSKARRCESPAAGLLQANIHLDPIAWRRDGGFIGTYPAIAVLIQHLSARRLGYRDRDEPSGILTHHLVQNPATWDFVERLFDFLQAHAGARIVGADEIWRQN